MTGDSSLAASLEGLRASLPAGSVFTYRVREDELELGVLAIPREDRGVGTTFLASVLASAARSGLGVRLAVDATDDVDDPSNFELIRWYARFGFVLDDVDGDGRPEMTLVPASGDVREILDAYARRKVADVTWDEVEAMLSPSPNLA